MSLQLAMWIAIGVASGIAIGVILTMRPVPRQPRHVASRSRPAWPTVEGDDPDDLHSTVVHSASAARGYVTEEGS
jgi:hypothetical protein